MGLYMESNAGGYSPGRMDQYLYPYYLHDRAEGILDDATALELIECFWIKSNDAVWYWDEAGIKHYAGSVSYTHLDVYKRQEHESFIFWYAKEQGWDKDEGLDFQIHFFQTGMDQLEACLLYTSRCV